MMRLGVVAFLCALLLPSPCLAQKRVALVIGNGAYEHTGSLPNPVQDAKLIAEVLRENRFEVALHVNADLKKMRRAIGDTAAKVRAYGKNTLVLFYFAGHGVQVKSNNYLIPVDAKIDTEGDVDIEGLHVASLLESLSDAGAIVNIIVLDACRNNPYRTSFRSPGRGLARVDAGAAGFLIAFSTDPGKVAADGPAGGNSPYTRALAASLSRKGIKVEEAFKIARREVYDATGGTQIPWDTSSLLHDIYMAGDDQQIGANQAAGDASKADDAALARLKVDLSKARVDAEAEKARAEGEIAKADAARRKAKTDLDRAKAEAEQAAAEVAKARAEADLARARAEAELARAEVDRQRALVDARREADRRDAERREEETKRSIAMAPIYIPPPPPPSVAPPPAQCGWFAIAYCSQDFPTAHSYTSNYGGYVIDTNTVAKFRSGWFCVVEGPMDRQAANSVMLRMKGAGAATAYVKNSC